MFAEMRIPKVITWIHFLLQLRLLAAAAAAASPGCPQSCGNITNIPYPFGVGTGCSREGFNLTCNGKKLYMADTGIEVLGISLPDGELLIGSKVAVESSLPYDAPWGPRLPSDGPYTLSSTRNKFTAIGCGVLASAVDPVTGKYASICASVCQETALGDGSCSGISCCQTEVPAGVRALDIRLQSLNQTPRWAEGLESKAFVVQQEWYSFSPADLSGSAEYSDLTVVPTVLDWTVGGTPCKDVTNQSDFACVSANSECYDSANGVGYRCNCSDGYQGNPYLPSGCQDIDECEHPEANPCYGTCINKPGTYDCVCPQGTYGDAKASRCFSSRRGSSTFSDLITGAGIGFGLLFLLLCIMWFFRSLKARQAKKLKQKFFKQNRGLLLQQLISSNKDVADRLKIFTLKELEKATDNFDSTRILGRGGHGTVYKGILADQRVVAIKKSKIVVQREIDQFINEVAILSQINHRNVVKLFGCCLEAEVPLLVYEFISDGTLFHHLHSRGRAASLSWEDRLRIAVEIARALSYLHTAASLSVFHRDVKSANILLDDGLTAKVSDFGASRTVALNQTRIATAIQGTFGYVDPEYFHTGQLTEKSDVYSFGVILVELLTGKKPVSGVHSQQGRNLATHFVWSMRENRLDEIIEARVMEEGQKEVIEAIATLAEMCLRLKGDERPTMKEVEVKLEALSGCWKKNEHASLHLESQESESSSSYPPTQGSWGNATRQYSLEKEFAMSSNFPR